MIEFVQFGKYIETPKILYNISENEKKIHTIKRAEKNNQGPQHR